MDEMKRVHRELTMAGVIVLAPGEVSGDISTEQKVALGNLHLRKIDLADRVLVVNPGGYVGQSASREIAYARAAGKPVAFTEAVTPDTALAAEINTACRLQGEFTLRSGQVSDTYFDKYLFEADPALLDRVVAQMVDLLPVETEVLGGLELGGIPIVTILSAKTGLPAIFVRKAAKAYGTAKLAEGPDFSGKRVTIVEDVITSGGAVRDAVKALRPRGAIVDTVVCAIDRSLEPGEALRDLEMDVRSVLTQSDLDAPN
ncbi:orotate phosphoribosyltransferase [Demetria terragena]|uniref:orotate phosphoribosyltransferase n=1 Tax=Demetria terragena TaxID=63959 RepID=UPI00315CB73A